MSEMTRQERLMAATRFQRADKLPYFHYWHHSQIGAAERECRNRGMGMNWQRPPFTTKLHDVKVTEEQAEIAGQTVYRRTYKTPVGTVYEDEQREPGTFLWHAARSWRDVLPWLTSHMIKGPEDYKVVKFIVEHTEYRADYFPIEQAMDWLGDEGVVMDLLPHSPMQTLLIYWVGMIDSACYFHLADYPELVDDLYEAAVKSRRPLHEIMAKSPAPISICGDNIDAGMLSPTLFEKYHMPFYEEQAAALHRHGKLMAVHMDGRLADLKDQIGRTPIDIIEAFHPTPMGDLDVGEALSAWKDKVLWLGFPGGIYALGSQATKERTISLLKEMGTGERVAVAMSTENLVSNEHLRILTSVLEKAVLPLTPERIAQIERDLA